MSGIFKVIITPDAQNDIRNYVRYIAQELANPQAAAALQEELRKEISSLNTMPARYKTIDEQPWGSIGVRKFKVKNYYIYYIIDEEKNIVSVFAVIYVRMNQKTQINKRNN